MNLVWLGEYPYKTLVAGDDLTGIRVESWRVEKLGMDGSPLGLLDGVQTVSLDWEGDRDIFGTGSLKWEGDSALDWMTFRVQPWYRAEFPSGNVVEWPLGVYIPATPEENWDDGSLSQTVQLYDKLLVLTETQTEDTYTVEAGTVVTAKVRELLAAAGVPTSDIAITDSAKTVPDDIVLEPGTPYLELINKLLKSINYLNLWADGYGIFNSSPFIKPEDRTSVWDFKDDEAGIYEPEFSRARDTFKVPNKYIGFSISTGGFEAERAEAANTDPASPYSYPARGRWITEIERDIDAADGDTLEQIVARRLAERMQVASTVSIAHWLIPLALDDVVTFRSLPAAIDIRATVQSRRIELGEDDMVDSSTEVREVLS